MSKVYGFGTGGKHRNTNEALTWRTATAKAAEMIRAAHPSMFADLVLEHAELEVTHAFHVANARQRAQA
jgi:hypothetical protein